MTYTDPKYMQKFRQKNKKTFSGWLTKVYGRMRQSSKERGEELPLFTKDQFKKWAKENDFEKLQKKWIDSGCKKELTPSVNRLNDYGVYEFKNMELITWEENNKKGRGSLKTKELAHSKIAGIAKQLFSKPVIKSDLTGKVLAIYPSAREAARQNGTDAGAIARVCRGEKITHHKSKWTYVTNR